MSSRRAAARAVWEFFEFINTIGEGSGQTVFRSYTRMGRISIPRLTYHRKLKKFEQHGLLKKHSTASGHIFHITAKAKALRHKAVVKTLRTDGLSSLVTFDIPEDKHNARDIFRRFLKHNGYTQIRESCFLSPFQISADLKELIHELKLETNVSVFSVKTNHLA